MDITNSPKGQAITYCKDGLRKRNKNKRMWVHCPLSESLGCRVPPRPALWPYSKFTVKQAKLRH